jgi:hypothetical protein
MSTFRRVGDSLKIGQQKPSSLAALRESVDRIKARVTSKSGGITPTMTDTPTVYGQYKTRMNQYVSPGISLGLDGQQSAYIHPTKAQGKKIFASKVVPMSDGTGLLEGAEKRTMSQRGYGNVRTSRTERAMPMHRIGFNNTLADTSDGKIKMSSAKPLDYKGIMMYPNNPVCSDFPKGAGIGGSAPMWEDGTYAMIYAQIQKKQEMTGPITFQPPPDPRKEIFTAQSLAGGEVFGNELMKQTLEDEFATMKNEELVAAARAARPLATEQQINDLALGLQVERRAERIAQQLRLPPGSQIARDAALDETSAEQKRRDDLRELQANIAAQAIERERAGKEQQRTALRNRVGRALSRIRLPGVLKGPAAEREESPPPAVVKYAPQNVTSFSPSVLYSGERIERLPRELGAFPTGFSFSRSASPGRPQGGSIVQAAFAEAARQRPDLAELLSGISGKSVPFSSSSSSTKPPTPPKLTKAQKAAKGTADISRFFSGGKK